MMKLAVAALVLAACVPGPAVQREYGGRVLEGRYVEPAAYAAFLRGAVAEAAGDAKGAVAAYEEAARLDPGGAEIRDRIAAVRGIGAQPGPAPTWSAGVDPATREALVAVTATARDQVVAWDALATWARAHGEVALWGQALARLAKAGPGRRAAAARGAEELAGAGELGEARAVAAAAADADEAPLRSDTYPLAARLAVDEAIARTDPQAARARATRVRLGLDEVAARAMLAGGAGLARELALPLWRADPEAEGARLVLAAGAEGDRLGAASALKRGIAARVPAAALVAFGLALAHAESRDDARAVLAAATLEPIVPGDDRVVRPAVELAARGVLAEAALPPDGVVELAALRGEAPALGAAPQLDARHEYLALSLAQPRAERTRELGRRLSGVAGRDAIVAAAAALEALGAGAPVDPSSPRSLLAQDPADPLLAAIALRVAQKLGDAESVRRARAALTALGAAPRPNVR